MNYPQAPKKQTQFKPNLVRRRRIPKGQNRLPENLVTPEPGTLDLTKDKWYRVIVACTYAYLHR